MKKRNQKPPVFAAWVLKHIMPDYDSFISKDLIEIYEEVLRRKGYFAARLWFWAQIFISLPHFLKDLFYWRTAMIRSYLTVAIRNLKRQKGFSFINISGLAIGMACSILIALWVFEQLSYDRFHKNTSLLYRVVENKHYSDHIRPFQATPALLAGILKDEYPEILDTARFNSAFSILARYKDKSFFENGVYGADPSFFKIFTFPFIKGDNITALDDPFSIVISEDMAEKYFGNEDPTGKVLTINDNLEYKVTGVMRNIPANSHIRFDMVANFDLLEKVGLDLNNWQYDLIFTYVLLKENASLQDLNKKIAGVVKRHVPDSITELYLQPLKDIWLYSNFDRRGGSGFIVNVYIALSIGIFILLIACINFMNLSTARSFNRAKEVGMRKVSGAFRKDLIFQFFGESVFMAVTALIFALLLVYLLLPEFNRLAGSAISLKILTGPKIILFFTFLTIMTGLISGIYPALFLSSFQPVNTLKGRYGTGFKNSKFRKMLVAFQFSLSIILISGTWIMFKQTNFLNNLPLGFQKDNLITISPGYSVNISSAYAGFKNSLNNRPEVTAISASFNEPTYMVSVAQDVSWEGRNPQENILINLASIDFDYIETFGLEVVKGRGFSKEFASDSRSSIIVNEEFVRLMKEENPVNRTVNIGTFKGNIIGVVKNFYYMSPERSSVSPMILFTRPDQVHTITVRLSPENKAESLAFVKMTWEKYYPGLPFVYSFIDDQFYAMYSEQRDLGKMVSFSALLAVIVACLGLLGLVSYTAERRTKEIGIRKTLGSTSFRIVVLICRDILKPVFAANVIAIPVAFFVMNRWLTDFANRTEIGLDSLLVPGLSAIAITLITVSYKAVKAARANPADALKYE